MNHDLDDRLDDEIRRALAELVDASPPPPDLRARGGSPLVPRPRRHPMVVSAVAVIAILVLVAVIATRSDDAVEFRTEGGTHPSTAPGPPPASVPVRPSIVAPVRLPVGVSFSGATASSVENGQGSRSLFVHADDGPVVNELIWRWGCDDPAVDRDDVIEQITAGSPVGIPWCEDGYTVNLVFRADPVVDVQLVQTLTFEPGTNRFLVNPPNGYAVTYEPAAWETVALRYATPEGVTALDVSIKGVDEPSLGLALARARAGGAIADLTTVAGFEVVTTAGGVVLQYDDRTLVTLRSDQLDAQQLLDAAVSLRAADADIAAAAGVPTPRRIWHNRFTGDAKMGAIVAGTVSYDEGNRCYLITGERTGPYPLVWPAGTFATADGLGVVLRDGTTVRPGDHLERGGGYLHNPDDYGIPPACLDATQQVAVLN